MAEENKSWFPNIGLLSESSLTGLPTALQDQMQREATRNMVLGGLLSGRADIGYQSAMGVPAAYSANQLHLLNLAEKMKQQQDQENFTRQFLPTQEQAGQTAMGQVAASGGGVGPTIKAAEAQKAIINAPIDFKGAYAGLARMGNNPAAANIREALGKLEPRIGEGGMKTGPGGVYLGTVPQISPSQAIMYGVNIDEKGLPVPYSTELPGAVITRGRIAGAETAAREGNTYRDMTLPGGAKVPALPSEIRAGAIGGATAQDGAGAVQQNKFRPQSANEAALLADAAKAYSDFSASVRTAASTANQDIQSNRTMYDIASRVNGNKFTGLTAEGAAWMRGLPFVGDRFDEFTSDVRLFAKEGSKQTLAGLNNIKGNANGFEGMVVQKNVSDITDPQLATKMTAAYGIATAEKNLAARDFISGYDGPVGQAEVAWSKSPNNPRIYNHPLVNQVLVDQVMKNPKEPVLPAGYKIVPRNVGNGVVEYGFKKPDGSVTPFATAQNGQISYKKFSD